MRNHLVSIDVVDLYIGAAATVRVLGAVVWQQERATCALAEVAAVTWASIHVQRRWGRA